MSLNAARYQHSRPRDDGRAEARAYLTGAINWRRDVYIRVPSLTRLGLVKRYIEPAVESINEALRDREKVLGHCVVPERLVPRNMADYDILQGHAWMRRMPFDRSLMVSYARAGGWLAACATHPGLLSCIRATVSPRGERSPRTKVGWVMIAFDAIGRGESPGRFYARVCRVQARASKIVGRKVGVAHAINAASTTTNNRRAAYIAAAMSMQVVGYIPRYREARALLALHLANDPERVLNSGVVPERMARDFRIERVNLLAWALSSLDSACAQIQMGG